MPSFIALGFSLPSLKIYVLVSFALSLLTLSYIHFTIVPNQQHTNIFRFEQPRDLAATCRLVISTILREPWALLVALNLMNCILVIAGRLLVWLVFNQLRPLEIQLAKDKLMNFLFYKFIFVFGIMNVQEVANVVGWFGWFSVLAFMHTFANVSNHRIRLYSSSPATSRKDLIKLSLLLTILFSTSISLFFFTILSSISSTNTFLFTLAESLILLTKTSYVFTKLVWYLGEKWGGWRMGDAYYTNLVFELSVLSIDLLHHLHMLLYGNIFFSMASLVVTMQLKQLFQALRSRLHRHISFQRVVQNMQARFPMVECPDETCAICWEPLEQARKLPCSHLFHNNCLRSWLEQDISCPTCRNNLRPSTTASSSSSPTSSSSSSTSTTPLPPPPPTPPPTPPTRRFNIYNQFHFDGARLFDWLPTFSFEVIHRRPTQESPALDNMVWQVREVFPQHPVEAIRADLRATSSIHATIENIAEGRLVADNIASYAGTTTLSTTTRAPTTTTITTSVATTTTSTTTTTPFIATATTATTAVSTTTTTTSTTKTTTPTSEQSFSLNPEEREKILKMRRDGMIHLARRRYLQKQGGSEGKKIEEGSSVD